MILLPWFPETKAANVNLTKNIQFKRERRGDEHTLNLLRSANLSGVVTSNDLLSEGGR